MTFTLSSAVTTFDTVAESAQIEKLQMLGFTFTEQMTTSTIVNNAIEVEIYNIKQMMDLLKQVRFVRIDVDMMWIIIDND
jgi:hypothetical protein